MSSYANVRHKLAVGTASWLNFEFHCLRGGLFSERYLAQPIGQLLNSAFPAMEGYRVQAEVDHPVLAPVSVKQGRKPQLDFCVHDRSKGIIVAVESKWSSRGDLDISDILLDLLRLELVSFKTEADCYFVLAGSRGRLDALFKEPSFTVRKAGGRTLSVLPVDIYPSARPIRLDGPCFPHRAKLYKKMKKYPGVQFPALVACSSPLVYPTTRQNKDFQTYVWKICARKTAHRFFPK